MKIGTTSGYPLNGNYKLDADITLPVDWAPLGSETEPFTGIFDGGGHNVRIESIPSAGTDISSVPGMKGFSEGLADDYGTDVGIIARGLFAYTENAVIENMNITVNPTTSFAVTSTAPPQAQLFGTVAAAALNTVFTNINISGGILNVNATSTEALYLGGIVGIMQGSSITDCTVDVKLQISLGSTTYTNIGGVVGYFYENSANTSITGCSVLKNVEVSGGSAGSASIDDNHIGGLVGDCGGGAIRNSFVRGNVSAVSAGGRTKVGGLVGHREGSIENCYATGNVSIVSAATDYVIVKAGGLVGELGNSSKGTPYGVAVIRKSYSAGNVSADEGTGYGEILAGGIAGSAYSESGGSGSITNCAVLSGSITCEGGGTAKRIVESTNFSLSYNIANSAMSGSSDPNGEDGADKTSTELSNQSTYTALGWDFSTVWKMEGGRPILKWQ
jgi:hypothetical protein